MLQSEAIIVLIGGNFLTHMQEASQSKITVLNSFLKSRFISQSGESLFWKTE